jgi:succinyl-CoA synthetase beta subunit
MVVHEYQAKQLFRQAGIEVPAGEVADTPEAVAEIARRVGRPVAVKAQVHVGGRGKAGGIKVAKDPDQARDHARAILGMSIKGLPVQKVLVEEALDIAREFYLGIVLDRARNSHLLMFSPMGGVDIEEVAEQHPEQIFRYPLHPLLGRPTTR